MSKPHSATVPGGAAFGGAPVQPDQEWANALTHGLASIAAVLVGGFLLSLVPAGRVDMTIAVIVYTLAAAGTFVCSTVSHLVRRQPLLDTVRAWDQAMIYLMIVGTYTPIVVQFAPASYRAILIAALWLAAGWGFVAKVGRKHRVNSISTVSYVALSWLPAIALGPTTPRVVAAWMLLGGLVYMAGIVFLLLDQRVKYFHAAWHLFVMTASGCHAYGMTHVILPAAP